MTSDLTHIETEVLRLVCEDLTAQQIADKLFRSKRTIDGHRQTLYKKTKAKGIAGLTKYAIRNGIIDINN